MKQNDIYTVAITGSIASGKSLAANYIKLRGYEVIDFDILGHQVLEDDLVKKDLAKEFGKIILDPNGNIDRKKLGNIVFSDSLNREKLNEISHPRIYEMAMEILEENKDEDLIFLEIPLLFETRNNFKEFYEEIDEIWTVSASRRIQLSRLMIRDKISMEEAESRIDAQLDMSIKEKLSDVILYNDKDIEDLYEETRIELNNLERKLGIDG